MGMLGKFIGGAAGAASEHYKQVNKDQMDMVRMERLAKMGVDAEEAKYKRSQERERQQLTDPESNLAIKQRMAREEADRSSASELSQYEEKLKIKQKYSQGKGRGKLEVVELPSGETDEDGTVITDLDGKPLTRQYYRDEAGQLRPLEGLVASRQDVGGLLTGGPGEPGPVDPKQAMKERMLAARAKRAGGKPDAEVDAAIETADKDDAKTPVESDIRPKVTFEHLKGARGIEAVSDPKDAAATAKFEELFEAGDKEGLAAFLASDEAKDMGWWDVSRAKKRFQDKYMDVFGEKARAREAAGRATQGGF